MTRLEYNNFVLQQSRKLYLVAFRFLKHREEAEDAVQEVFIRLWNRRDKLEEYNSIEALAVTTVKNYCIDQLRKSRTISIEEIDVHKFTIMNEPSADEKLENAEIATALKKIIQQLPDIYRDIITLKEIDGLSYEEIASITDQNLNTLRVNLSRARKMIRDEFIKTRYEYTGNNQAARKVL